MCEPLISGEEEEISASSELVEDESSVLSTVTCSVDAEMLYRSLSSVG